MATWTCCVAPSGQTVTLLAHLDALGLVTADHDAKFGVQIRNMVL
mgnify:CR=1 FL=1